MRELLAATEGIPAQDALLAQLDRVASPGLPTRDALREIAEAHSNDVAAAFFVRRILDHEPNRRLQAVYAENLARFHAAPEASEREVRRVANGYSVIFAPGWLYHSHPTNGADFHKPRRLLEAIGIENRLLPTSEDGTVEHNAGLIARALRETSSPGQRTIVVSTSKSGAEVALALGSLLSAEDLTSVAAWINIGGVLQGSPLADIGLSAWGGIVRLWFAASGWDWAGLESMGTSVRRAQFEKLRLPEHLLVVNFVAVPLERDVSFRAWTGYELLRGSGPNDGLMLLRDQIVPGGLTVIQPGTDHYFALPDIELRSAALLKSVLDALGTGEPHLRIARPAERTPPARAPLAVSAPDSASAPFAPIPTDTPLSHYSR